jgi:hypothetical protein
MKYLNMILALLLVGIVAAHAAQKVTFTQREVRDPRQLAPALEANAADAQSRLATLEGGAGAGGVLASGKIIVGNSGGTGEAQTVTGAITISNTGVAAMSAGVIVNADIATNAAIAGSKLDLSDPGAIGGTTPAAGAFTTLNASGTTTLNTGLDGAVQATAGVISAGTLPVASGGTGAATLTGVLKGNGTGAVTAAAQLAVADGGTGAATLTGLVKGNGTSAMSAAVADTDYVQPSTWNALRAYLADGLLVHGALAISAGEADQFKTTATAVYTIAGVTYTKAATDALEFTAADTINTAGGDIGPAFGIWLVQINAAGAVSTKPGGGLSDQVYESSALAIAALPSPDASNVSLGYILVETPTSTPFVCNTTALTTIGAFSNTQIKALPAAL